MFCTAMQDVPVVPRARQSVVLCPVSAQNIPPGGKSGHDQECIATCT